MNALKNGSRLNAQRLVVGELPPAMISVKREGRKYRRFLEDAVRNEKGDELSVMDIHLIDTASALTLQAGVLRWLLRNRMEQMSPGEIRNCMADIVKAKERRDLAVEALELDADELDDFYGKMTGLEVEDDD